MLCSRASRRGPERADPEAFGSEPQALGEAEVPATKPATHGPEARARRLPPTTEELLDDSAQPYFLWWTDVTVAELRDKLRSDDPAERAYWMGALLREANTRDVRLFVSPDDIRALWPHLLRHLGRSRQMWSWLLDLPDSHRPPPGRRGST
jgi:hypothetical protein